MSMMFPDGNDKSFLSQEDLKAIDAFWAYAVQSAIGVSDAFVSEICPQLDKNTETRDKITIEFVAYLIMSVIHRLSQHLDGERYFAVMLEQLNDICEKAGLCLFMYKDQLHDRGFTDEQIAAFGKFLGVYVAVNNYYIQKAPEAHNYGFFEKMKIKALLQARGKGLTLNVGDYLIGYTLIGSYFVNWPLKIKVGEVPRSKLEDVYRLIEAAFVFYYEKLVEAAFAVDSSTAKSLLAEEVIVLPEEQKTDAINEFRNRSHLAFRR